MWAFFVSEIFYFQEPVTCVRPDAADDKASSGTSASVVTGVVLAGGAGCRQDLCANLFAGSG